MAEQSKKVVERVRGVAVEDLQQARDVATEAFKSKAYLFPIQGFYYFITHKALWRPLMSRLAPTITLSLGVTTLMFFVAYLPQAAIMAFTSGPIAAFSAALLTLSESSTIINLLSRTFLIEDALIDTFDGTLLSKECTNLVSSERQINASGDPIARLGKLMKKPFAKFTPNAIIRYVMYLPLNFIPIIGTVMFIFLQGKRNGPSAHSRYFQLKQWTKRQQDAFVEQNRGGYTSFGVISFLLEMIPFANLVFAFTNTVGAALWAAELEKSAGTAPKLREQARKAQAAESQ